MSSPSSCYKVLYRHGRVQILSDLAGVLLALLVSGTEEGVSDCLLVAGRPEHRLVEAGDGCFTDIGTEPTLTVHHDIMTAASCNHGQLFKAVMML